MMIEIEVAPAARSGKALGILDGHIGAIELSAEKTAPGRLGARTIGKLCWQCELQFLEQDCPFGEFIRLLEYLVLARLDVDVVILREAGLAAIKRIGSERRSDVYPFVEILRQDQIAGGGVLGQLAGLCLRAAARERLYEEGRCDYAAREQRGYCEKSCAHRCSPIALLGIRTHRHWEPSHGMEVIQLTRERATSLGAILSVLRDYERA